MNTFTLILIKNFNVPQLTKPIGDKCIIFDLRVVVNEIFIYSGSVHKIHVWCSWTKIKYAVYNILILS